MGLSEVRTVLEDTLRGYEESDGVGPDDYEPTPQQHAMADGKYLQALAAMRRAGLLGAGPLQERVEAAVARLTSAAVPTPEGTAAWGLGFAYRDAPAGEPYAITSAIVTLGLLEVQRLVPGAVGLEQLTSEAVRWLDEQVPHERSDGVDLPLFSPHIALVVNNVVAYWSGALATARADGYPIETDAEAAAAWVVGKLVDDIGWTYREGSNRVDLLHTCYIGAGLRRALPPDRWSSLEPDVMAAVTQFRSPSGWQDGYDLEEREGTLQQPTSWARRLVRLQGEHALVGFARPARPWAVGELLVLVAEASMTEVRTSAVWWAQLRWLAAHIAGEHLPEPRVRHGMHLAHGLAAALEAARSPRNSPSEPTIEGSERP